MPETVTLRRGASNGAELRIELNRPDTMNAWNEQFGDELLAAVEEAAADDDRPRRDDHRHRPGFSSGADLKAGFEPTPGGPSRRRHRVARALPPDHHDGPGDAQAGARGRQRPRGRHRLLARARLRPDHRQGVGLLPARVREHRPRARRRLLAAGSRARGPARASEMAMLGERIPAPKALEWGLINRVAADDVLRGRGRRAGRAAGDRPDPLLRRLQAPAQRLDLRAHGRSSSSSRPRIQHEMAASATSWRACRPSWGSAPPEFKGS